ncbi:MAG: four helix bundle protein [Candidatus Doudnabacteria bacterium]|nr:four helix bundle protein [Candidatus Doudnabacteria bacterium]
MYQALSEKNMDKAQIKIKSFTDLVAWEEGHKLVLMIYKLSKFWPKEDQFGPIDQIRRAVVSITSNTAEGFTLVDMLGKIKCIFIQLPLVQ